MAATPRASAQKDEFAVPQKRKKKPSAWKKKKEEEQQEKEAGPKYRDRAEERRTGRSADYEESEKEVLSGCATKFH